MCCPAAVALMLCNLLLAKRHICAALVNCAVCEGCEQTVGLQADKEWLAYIGLHGPLQLFLGEQRGELVGPRPEKPAPVSQASGEGEGEGRFGGSIFSSEQLVRFLQSIGKGAGGNSGFT